jgi:WD40 repeat protein
MADGSAGHRLTDAHFARICSSTRTAHIVAAWRPLAEDAPRTELTAAGELVPLLLLAGPDVARKIPDIFLTSGVDIKLRTMAGGGRGWPLEREVSGHTGAVSACAWSPDGTWLASASAKGMVIVSDANTGREVFKLGPMHDEDGPVFVSSCAWSPDGTRLATASWDGNVRVWDVSGSTARGRVLEGHSEDEVNCCAWSPDGRWLASSSDDSTVRVWNTNTWLEVARLAAGAYTRPLFSSI